MKSASLTLIPTPIAPGLPLESVALKLLGEECLKSDSVILVEEHKVARQNWIRWGLPREVIEKFQLVNEHTQHDALKGLIAAMKSGQRYFLMSDCGLPAFCDPGQSLVNACHEAHLRVTSTPFPNSIALAVALSGFSHQRFYFAGFLPANSQERKKEIESLAQTKDSIVLMDTPYRLEALVADLAASKLKTRKIFLALDLNSDTEELFRTDAQTLLAKAKEIGKREFVMVIQSL